LSWLAEVEFKTRLEFPGSTFRPKDWFGVINEEYCAMARLHSFEGLAVQGDPRKGFILWWNNLEKSNSIVVHLWVDPKYRGFGYGQFLIGDMLCKIQSAKITSCRYFVSAQNINALKILFKSKFSLKYCVINKAVKRKELL
jgi:GNAT superfamily N-acetyltransferase